MIPDEAVEAAAEDLYDREGFWGPLDEAPLHRRRRFRARARTALEAAAPHMRRIITTTAELDALGRNAAIMQPGGTVLVHDGQVEDPWASYSEDPFSGPTWTDSSNVTLPVTVLHEGDSQ